MVTKKDILELKRRFKKEECTFTKMTGCYVDCNKNKVVKINETFLNLDDEEFFKYLEIAKKALSGTVGNNLLELDFPEEEELPGGKQHFFMALRQSELKNDDLLDRFYDLIIENYGYVGNYLILLFHDAYDVITKTEDNLKLDESEEVYEYLLCAICPVCLTKPGLGYREDENRIGPRIRDWVVGAPDSGFLFPSFSERSADIHTITYYVKDAKDSHPEFIADALGCGPKRTATEQKQVFQAFVKRALAPVVDDPDDVLLDIQESISNMVEEKEDIAELDAPDIPLSTDTFKEVLQESGVPETVLPEIEKSFTEEFGDCPPVAKILVDEKAVAANIQAKKEQELQKQVQELKEIVSNETVKTYDVILRVKPEKETQIKVETIDGQKCLVIPMDEDEHLNVNGVNTNV
ncbi:MAG: DUF4317 domain-containing protein [Lachnospiraceae bacterium]|nr:DUF4317 domain-containing protein [Lachnospiraceae bacterium]